MPLTPGNSDAVKGHNIVEMIRAGHPRNVAIAASLSNARKHPHKQGGGGVAGGEPMEHFGLGGFLNSSVPGRTDRIPTSVMSDSYVIPADIISGLGQGNSLAGAHIMDAILKTGPYGSQLQSPRHTGNNIPRPPAPYHDPGGMPVGGYPNSENAGNMAKGGNASKSQKVVLAGAEYVIHPVDVMRIGGGSLTRGHKLLDDFVRKMRKEHIKTLSNLPPPKA